MNHVTHNLTLEELFGSKTKIRILQMLVERNLVSITELRKKSRASYKILKRYLNDLKNAGLLSELTYNRVRLYTLNRNNPKVRVIEEFFRRWRHLE